VTTDAHRSDGLVIDVTIEDGSVTPTNERFQGRVGEPITIRVTSDTDDELHVHSIPEHTFAVAPRADQTFEFTVEVPGQAEIELHDLHRTIATVPVRQCHAWPTASAVPPICRFRSPMRSAGRRGRWRSPSRWWRSPGGGRGSIRTGRAARCRVGSP